MMHSPRTFWRRISDGVELQRLWSQFSREGRASYTFYANEVDSRLSQGHGRWGRFPAVSRILFWAMISKLSPARRVLLLLSLLLLAVPLFTFRYQGLTFWGGAGFLILLAMELADRVMMKRDVEIAREIQSWMMPATPPAVPGVDIAFESRAANTVGGDYYDVFFRSPDSARDPTEPERLLFIVADVAGKSVPAALVVANLQASFRVLAGLPISLLELIERLNRYICTLNVSGCRFSTAFIAELELCDRRLTYVNAGHNWPVLRREDGTLERLEIGGPPLGIMRSAGYTCGSMSLAAGDVMLIFSDGLTEAEDDKQQEFGEPGVLALMDNACGKSAADVLAQVLRSVDSFVGPALQHDDITCMVVRMSAPA
jgi:phosphoserine phosphatase RsbU/P